MAYQRKTYLLKWPEDHELHGLEIKLKGLTIGDMQIMGELKDMEERFKENRDLSLFEPFVELLSKKIVSWNYEDDDHKPIPVSEDAIRELDLTELIPALMQWMEKAAGGISAPLKNGSSSGESAQEVSIPMEALSPSPQS